MSGVQVPSATLSRLPTRACGFLFAREVDPTSRRAASAAPGSALPWRLALAQPEFYHPHVRQRSSASSRPRFSSQSRSHHRVASQRSNGHGEEESSEEKGISQKEVGKEEAGEEDDEVDGAEVARQEGREEETPQGPQARADRHGDR